jgi:hypothetical protein
MTNGKSFLVFLNEKTEHTYYSAFFTSARVLEQVLDLLALIQALSPAIYCEIQFFACNWIGLIGFTVRRKRLSCPKHCPVLALFFLPDLKLCEFLLLYEGKPTGLHSKIKNILFS